jgi:hypothetical protein
VSNRIYNSFLPCKGGIFKSFLEEQVMEDMPFPDMRGYGLIALFNDF